MAGRFDLRDPRIFRSDRPPALELCDAPGDFTAVDPPPFFTLPSPGHALPEPADEEPWTTIYRPSSTRALVPAALAADFEPTRVDGPAWSREPPTLPPRASEPAPTQEQSRPPGERPAKRRRSSRRPKKSSRVRTFKIVFAACILGTWALALTLRGDALLALLIAAWERWLG
jgi:hypothetical protein